MIRRVKFANNKKVRFRRETHQKTASLNVATHLPKQREREYVFYKKYSPLSGILRCVANIVYGIFKKKSSKLQKKSKIFNGAFFRKTALYFIRREKNRGRKNCLKYARAG